MKLQGMKVLLTGTFAGMSHGDVAAELEKQGAKVVQTLSGVSMVFAGDEPGDVLDDALEQGLVVHDEEGLRAVLSGEAPAVAAGGYDDGYAASMAGGEEVPPFFDDDPAFRPASFSAEAPPAFLDDAPQQGSTSRPERPAAAAGGSGFDKGSRVRITGGREGVGQIGEIFWWGASKFGEGMRAGVEADNGQKYWVDEEHLGQPDAEVSEAAIEAAREAEQFGKGDRVRVTAGRDAGAVGEIFWWGPSKFGEGMRAGIETDDGNKVWADAGELAALDGSTPAPAASSSSRGGSGGGGGGRASSTPAFSPATFDDDDIPF